MKIRRLTVVVVGMCLTQSWPFEAAAGDWPTYRGDVRRNGVSGERLDTPLSEDWAFQAAHPPEHAWGDPHRTPHERVLELPRLRFDDAFHVVAAGDAVYFGSSADGKVHALDAATGRVRWEFYTDGPVRLAPTVWRGKLYVGSDDGNVYCLNAATGKAVWAFRAAPGERKILGNGKMISIWPVRTGVLIDEGTAYFGAGVFPAEGLYLYAVDAETGELVWKNDSYGRGGNAEVSPQGYLVASADKLFVPSCRAMAAAFDRKTGRFLYQSGLSWRGVGLFGGWQYQLADGILFGGTEQIVGTRESDGRLAVSEFLPARLPTTGHRRLVVGEKTALMLTGKELLAVERESWLKVLTTTAAWKTQGPGIQGQIRRLAELDKQFTKRREAAAKDPNQLPPPSRDHQNVLREKAALQKQYDKLAERYKALADERKAPPRWSQPFAGSDSLALIGQTAFAGGDGVVTGFDAETGKRLWSGEVNGKARGLAAANGRLLVTTDKGSIHCFVPGGGGAGKKVAPAVADAPFGPNAAGRSTAARVVDEGGVTRGFGLNLAEPNAKNVAAARKALSAGGVYGKKVVVMQLGLKELPFADYFANLIVCRPDAEGNIPTPAAEVLRMLKPCGGAACVVGGKTPGRTAWTDEMAKALKQLDETQTKVILGNVLARIARGSLAGAGSWTHQYGEPGNTACGDDELIHGPIGILWYGQPGPERMPTRHASNVSPVSLNGRMFIQGEDVVMAYDAYNGLELWTREIKGATRLGMKMRASNLAAVGDSVYVAIGDRCLRLDVETGRTKATYTVPPSKDKQSGPWEFLAVVGDLVYGSRGSQCVFAIDVDSGKLQWAHEGATIEPRTICVGDARVYLVERAVTDAQRDEAMKGLTDTPRKDSRGRPVPPDVRLVVALNAHTGRVDWTRPQYVGDCVNISKAGGDLTVMYAHNVLLLAGQPWNGHFWREFMSGEFSRRSLIAMAGHDGRPLWSGRKGYRSRPLIVGDQIIAEPWAHDLETGEVKLRANPITGAQTKWQMARPGHHCGNIAAAPNALFYRSGVTAYYDLTGDWGTAHFAGQRPGCWINCIPANGLVMMPEAASGCVCAFALQCTTVFQPRKANRVWGMYSAAGPLLPVKTMAINFGAPGDRRDSDGTLWLAYPRPRDRDKDADQRLVLNFDVEMAAAPGGSVDYFRNNGDFLKVAGSEDPWIYAFGCDGLARCAVPLIDEGGQPAKYTVRLHFAAPADEKPGGRVFDVSLQGKRVLKSFDPLAAGGGPDKAVIEEFKNVRVTGALEISLKATQGAPRLCGVEVLRQP